MSKRELEIDSGCRFARRIRFVALIIGSYFISGLAIGSSPASGQSESDQPFEQQFKFEVERTFQAREAHQGVAVDRDHFYAISNRAIGKYSKESGKLIKRWQSNDESIKHLNSGVVVGNRLNVAHSNWPQQPSVNTLEILDAESLTYVGRHRFAENELAVTWVDKHRGDWWAVFAAYGTAKSVSRTKLVRFDSEWNRMEEFDFSPTLIERFVPYSNSGGSFGKSGLLYLTGHDRAEIYVLELPGREAKLKTLRWRGTIPLSIQGQAIAWDRGQPSTLFGIRRKSNEVVAARLLNPNGR